MNLYVHGSLAPDASGLYEPFGTFGGQPVYYHNAVIDFDEVESADYCLCYRSSHDEWWLIAGSVPQNGGGLWFKSGTIPVPDPATGPIGTYMENTGVGDLVVMPYISITAITEAAGVVTLTVAADGPVDIYRRLAGQAMWVMAAAAQAAGNIAISGLTAGAMYEFYAVELLSGLYYGPSNIATIYLHNSSLPTIKEVESWAVGVLAGLSVFKTCAIWQHQLAATQGGLSKLDSLAPCAFVGEQPSMNAEREGGYALNRKLTLVVLIAQQTLTDGGAARIGSDTVVGTEELRSLVIAAVDQQNPGNGLGLDDFSYIGAEEVVDFPRQHAVKMIFEANWTA